jgi:hypothetical protein
VADDSPPDWRTPETFSFGDNPALVDELALCLVARIDGE